MIRKEYIYFRIASLLSGCQKKVIQTMSMVKLADNVQLVKYSCWTYIIRTVLGGQVNLGCGQLEISIQLVLGQVEKFQNSTPLPMLICVNICLFWFILISKNWYNIEINEKINLSANIDDLTLEDKWSK
jgi:hypothetical protein